MVGDTSVTCGSIGLYHANLTCEPVLCGPEIANLNSNAEASCGTLNDQTFGGDSCIATCKPGYELSAGDGVFTCSASGQWVGELSCRPLDCGDIILGLSDNAVADCSTINSNFDGDACTASCAAGFSGSGNADYVCNTAGLWEGSFSCTPVDCGPTVDLTPFNAGGLPAATCSGSTFYQGDDCVVACPAGYVTSDPDQAGTFTCNTDGEWNGKLLCSPIECEASIANLDLNAEDDCVGVLFEEPCDVPCRAGFQNASSRAFICTADGTLVGDLECERVSCGAFSTPNTGIELASTCTGTVFEDACSVQCRVGFEPDTGTVPSDYMCDADGSWMGPLTCKRVSCGLLESPTLPANVVTTCTNSLFEDSCTVACAPGFERSNITSASDSFTCQANRQWTGVFGCQPKNCGATIPEAAVPLNAIPSLCTGNTKFGGDVCQATCRTGYQPVANTSTSFLCGVAGEWESNLECEAVDCSSTIANLPPRAQASCEGNTRFEGNDCVASCAPGYTAINSSQGIYTCNSAGQWQGTIACEPVDCGQDIPFVGIEVSDSFANCTGSTKFGNPEFGDMPGTCQALCTRGYINSQSGQGIFTCGADGQWQGSIKCDPVACGPLDQNTVDPNATPACIADDFQATCNVECNPGFEPTSGAELYVCDSFRQVDGNWVGNWTGAVTCEAKDCGSTIANLSNAIADCSGGSTLFGGDKCTAVCDTGYDGGMADYTCGTEGKWVGMLTCTRKCFCYQQQSAALTFCVCSKKLWC